MPSQPTWWGAPISAVTAVTRSPRLRRLQLAWGLWVTAEVAAGLALAVSAYRAGGAEAVGVLGLVRMLPAVVFTPVVMAIADRFEYGRFMAVLDGFRAVVLTATAAAMVAGAPLTVIYTLVGIDAALSTTHRPLQVSLFPFLARTPSELVASNVAASVFESFGWLVGALLAGALLSKWSDGAVVAGSAALFLGASILVASVRTDAALAGAEHSALETRVDVVGGIRASVRIPGVRTVVYLFGAQTLVRGALSVLLVLASFRRFDVGASGVGFITSGLGIGAVLGSFATVWLIGRHRMGTAFGASVLMWGLPIAGLALVSNAAAAAALLIVTGMANASVDVAGDTLLQRAVPDHLLPTVFGLVEVTTRCCIGIGAIVAPALVGWLGLESTLVITGTFLPVVALVAWGALRRLDRTAQPPERELEALQRLSMFAPLSLAPLERVAKHLATLHMPAGTQVIRQGAEGDLFFIVQRGELEVTKDGQRVAEAGPGDHFGEIALLHDVPRQATVTAVVDSDLWALEREDFLTAITGNVSSAAAAREVVERMLGHEPRGAGS